MSKIQLSFKHLHSLKNARSTVPLVSILSHLNFWTVKSFLGINCLLENEYHEMLNKMLNQQCPYCIYNNGVTKISHSNQISKFAKMKIFDGENFLNHSLGYMELERLVRKIEKLESF